MRAQRSARRAARTLVALPITGGMLLAAVAAAPAETGDRARARLYHLRLRAEPSPSSEPGRCLALGREDLVVRLRGKRVAGELLRLEPDRRPALHLLLLDTSDSMAGWLADVREAATGYVERLHRERERALVVSFDESVELRQAATSDPQALRSAIASMRLGGNTAVHDALRAGLREARIQRERPVLLLLGDGVDTTSLYERRDVLALVDDMPELTVFTIGLGLLPIRTGGPSGLASSRRFLQRLSSRTHGRFFDVPTGGRLPAIYRRIREMVDGERTLTVTDPDPEAPPGHVRVRSLDESCDVQILAATHEGRDEPATRTADELPPLGETARAVELPAGVALLRRPVELRDLPVDPGCPADGTGGRVALTDAGFRGCLVDSGLDAGLYYAPMADGWAGTDGRLAPRVRRIEIPLPPPAELPDRPELLLDGLARAALERAGDEVDGDPLRQPAALHARPFHDLPLLVNGRVLLDQRPGLARLLAGRADYRRWLQRRLEEEAGREIAALVERLRRVAPGREEAELTATALESEEGRRIVERAARPSGDDAERWLGAWLGDVPAHDWFVAWERDRLSRRLAGAGSDDTDFVPGWVALHRVFFAPSYARVLGLLSPGRDPRSGRIGFWRVVLPRPSWIARRIKGWERPPDLAVPPLDLVPDLPLGFHVVDRLLAEPAIVSRLGGGRYDVERIDYTLVGPSGRHTPARAFERARVAVVLRRAGGSETVTLDAEVALERAGPELAPRPGLVTLAVRGDAELAGLAAGLAPAP